MAESVFELDLEALFAEEGYVRRLARGLLLDDHAVDDVVQQTWVAALRHPPTESASIGETSSGSDHPNPT